MNKLNTKLLPIPFIDKNVFHSDIIWFFVGKNIDQKSRGRLIGEEIAKYAAIAGTIFLLVPTDPSDIVTTAPLSVKLTALIKSTRLFRLLTKTKFLKPGKDIPQVSKMGLEAKAEKILQEKGFGWMLEDPKRAKIEEEYQRCTAA